jgi:hypothetical protein
MVFDTFSSVLIPASASLLSSLSSTQGGVFERLRRHRRSTFPSVQVLATLGLTDAKIVFIFLLLSRLLALEVHSPVPFARASHPFINRSMPLPSIRTCLYGYSWESCQDYLREATLPNTSVTDDHYSIARES